MNPAEKKALKELKNDLYNYPEVIMLSVSRKDLETVINYLEKVQKNASSSPTK
ncbi:hypothetical protein [Desemzia incerta]|uniref:hypothetical protein n=1 Tax=Desemzia incerta TaxID=82801 RepID=UPI00166063A9|nr:hypothetical protein [Desemzia incerta]